MYNLRLPPADFYNPKTNLHFGHADQRIKFKVFFFFFFPLK